MPASGLLFLPPPLTLRDTLGCHGLWRILLRLRRHAQKVSHNLSLPFWEACQRIILVLHIGNLTEFLDGWES